ncbi:MAG: hypothetical protein EOP47_21120 [Sphingobacteriaceae bacterium]|nr:MAG: hypothetical protein EOP47_21120 [Sphingobacteriaceae bacterium]
MKEYFTNLFKYDRYSSLLLLPVITEAGNPAKAVQIMAHILAAQQVWIDRCKGLSNANNAELWPDWQADTFEQLMQDCHMQWLSIISDSDLDQTISYKSLKGIAFESTLTDILTHVINHGTHHRGQIGQYLKFAGIEELPILDYIAFTRI